MGRQDQSVEGGEAYQSFGNLTVNRGMDASQMAELMLAMGKQLQVYFAEAEAKLDEQLAGFRESVLKEFAKPENKENTEAFADPSFQFVLNDAQKAYARDGSPSLRDDLVGLLVERSRLHGSDRASKILSRAISTAGSLGKHEYAALAINFFIEHVKLAAASKSDLVDQVADIVIPFINDITDNLTTYEYLEELGCSAPRDLRYSNLARSVQSIYSSVLGSGFSEHDITNVDPDFPLSRYGSLICRTGSAQAPFRFSVSGPDEVYNALMGLGMQAEGRRAARDLQKRTSPTKEETLPIFFEKVPGYERLEAIWNNSLLSNLNLTSTGIAIAHASLSSRTPFKAPLSIWIG